MSFTHRERGYAMVKLFKADGGELGEFVMRRPVLIVERSPELGAGEVEDTDEEHYHTAGEARDNKIVSISGDYPHNIAI